MSDLYDLAPWLEPVPHAALDAEGRWLTRRGVALVELLPPPPLRGCLPISGVALDVSPSALSDAPDFDAIEDWIELPELASVGVRGRQAAAVTFEPLEGDCVQRSKDIDGFPQMMIKFAYRPDCLAQAALREQTQSLQQIALRLRHVIGGTGITEYIGGYVLRHEHDPISDPSSIKRVTAEVAVNHYAEQLSGLPYVDYLLADGAPYLVADGLGGWQPYQVALQSPHHP